MADHSTVFRELVARALSYPSGDNCQPWRFVSDGVQLHILFERKRAEHPLDVRGLASALSLGCLIEIISLLARERGFQLSVEYYDLDGSKGDCGASLRLRPNQNLVPDELTEFLELRSTDRRVYDRGNIPWKKIQQITDSGDAESFAKVHGVDVLKSDLRNFILESEKFLFHDPRIFSRTLEWTRTTSVGFLSSRDGLSAKNMGIRPFEVPGLRLLQLFPSLLKVFKGLLEHRHLKSVRRQLASSAGLLCVSIPGNRISSAPEAGRMMMRVWLELTRCGFGVQPISISSTLVFAAQAGLLDQSVSPHWKKHFESGVSIFSEAFNLAPNEVPIWMIRTGRSSVLPLALRTLRKPVEEVFSVRAA